MAALNKSSTQELFWIKTAEQQAKGKNPSNLKCFTERLIEIKQGFKNGHKLVYNKLGNEASGMTTCNFLSIYRKADLIFTIHEIPHKDFKRKDNDLIYIA